jgi:hypothetical protein
VRVSTSGDKACWHCLWHLLVRPHPCVLIASVLCTCLNTVAPQTLEEYIQDTEDMVKTSMAQQRWAGSDRCREGGGGAQAPYCATAMLVSI